MQAQHEEVGGFRKKAQPRRNAKARDEQAKGRKHNKPKRFDKTSLQ